MPIWNAIIAVINSSTQSDYTLSARHSVGGGCINEAWKLEGTLRSQGKSVARNYFVKTNQKSFVQMFEAEYDALLEIAATNTVLVPKPVACGTTDDRCWIVMDYIEMPGPAAPEILGRQLADLHKHTSEYFGWHRDNTIGSTPQINSQSKSWLNFWRDQRLGYQLQTAANNGYGGKLQALGEQLMSKMDGLFQNYSPQPSLLHGDLWGGNWSGAVSGRPVIYDPASYYGDREADIAMTELFGGFPHTFYESYSQQWPLHPDYAVRKNLYNLYHVLNHLNIFGGSYCAQAESMLASLLSEI